MLLQVLPLVLAMSGQGAPPQQAPPQPAPAVKPQARAPRPVYAESADATAAVAAAVQAAAEDDLRVLINWGANDDPSCAKFPAALAGGTQQDDTARNLRTKLTNEYKMVTVDVGHLDKNQDLARQYHAAIKAGELPFITVLDKRGTVLANVSSKEFASAADPAAFEPRKILAFLEKHQVAAVDAQPLFTAALRKAKAENKELFLWFSAPW